MDDRFADWYRAVDPAPRPETLDSRWGVIEALAERAYWDLALDLVRLYAGVPQRDVASAGAFVGEFKKADTTLSMRDNDQLIRTLAGAALAAILRRIDAVSDATALALVSTRFASQGKEFVNADLEEDVDRYLVTRSRVARNPDRPAKASTLASRIGKVKIPQLATLSQMGSIHEYQAYNGAAKAIATYATDLGKSLEKLRDFVEAIAEGEDPGGANGLERFPEWNAAQEELNILWWLYGEFSRDLERPAPQLGIEQFAIVAGKELADLTTVLPGILSAEAMLRRALRATGGELDTAVGLRTLVDALPSEWRRNVLGMAETVPAKLGRIAPLHQALRRSVEDGDGWLPALVGAAALPGEPQISPVAAAQQMYHECLLGRSLVTAVAAPRSKWTLGEDLNRE